MWVLLGPGIDLVAGELCPAAKWGSTPSPEPQAAGQGTLDLLRRSPWLLIPLGYTMALLFLTYGLAAAGLRLCLRRGGSFFVAACLVPLLYLLVVSVGGWAYYRFRVPLWPFVAFLAGAGWRRLTGPATEGPSSAPSR